MKLILCAHCQDDAELTVDDKLDHTARLIEDYAVLQSLTIIHGPKTAARRYVEMGRAVHMTLEEWEAL